MEEKLIASLEEEVQHAELPSTVEPYPLATEPESPPIPEAPVQAVANQLGDVAVDSVRLVELQARLFEIELRQSALNMVRPVGILGVAAIVLFASTILLFLGLGTGLHQLTGMPLSIAQLLIAVLGLAAAAAAGWSAMQLLKEPRISFTKSKEELMRNVEFFGRMIKPK